MAPSFWPTRTPRSISPRPASRSRRRRLLLSPLPRPPKKGLRPRRRPPRGQKPVPRKRPPPHASPPARRPHAGCPGSADRDVRLRPTAPNGAASTRTGPSSSAPPTASAGRPEARRDPAEALPFFAREVRRARPRGRAARAAGRRRTPRRRTRRPPPSSRSGLPSRRPRRSATSPGSRHRLAALEHDRSSAQRERARAERAKKLEEATPARSDRRRGREALHPAATGVTGPTGCVQLLDEWKALPRLEKSADDALWRRFSTARTTYTRRRKAHFASSTEARGRAGGQGEARRRGRGALDVDRVGTDRREPTAT